MSCERLTSSFSVLARRGFSLRDLLVLLVVLALFPLAAAQLASRSREAANRIKCASNLRQIGQALAIYASENRGAFPRASYDKDAADPVPTEYTGGGAPNPFGPGGPALNDVTAGLFLLLRTGDLIPETFVCPTSDGVPLAGDVLTMSNFPSRANLTYGYANPYPGATARGLGFKMNHTLGSEFAVAADMGRGPDVGMVAANAPRAQMMRANSPWHQGEGQNVLFGDGHVDWFSTIFAGSPRPIVGAPKDNIFAYGVDSTTAAPSTGIRGAPQDQYDSVVLPTADMGPQPGPLPAPGQSRREQSYLLVGIGAVLVFGMIVAGVVVFLKTRQRDDQFPPTPPPPPPPNRGPAPPPLPPLPTA